RTGLMLTPDETGVFGNSGLVVKSCNVADLRENAGGVHGTDARDRLQCIWDSAQDALNSLIEFLDLRLDAADRLDRCTENEIDRILNHLREAVRRSGSLLDAFGDSLWIREAILPVVLEVICKIRHVHSDDLVKAVLLEQEFRYCMTEDRAVDFGGKGAALVKQVRQEILLLSRQIMNE